MEKIKEVMLIVDKGKRYDGILNWINDEIFRNRISILEINEFSDQRKIRNNNKKLIATVIYSQDPESSAFLGPFIKLRIFEKQDSKKWVIDMIFKPFRSKVIIYRDLDFTEFVNKERMKIMKDFIWQ